jgi:chromate transporter
VLFATALGYFGHGVEVRWLHGLKVIAVVVVAQAIWGMGVSLCPDRGRAAMAVADAVFIFLIPGPASQTGVILLGGLAGSRKQPSERPLYSDCGILSHTATIIAP